MQVHSANACKVQGYVKLKSGAPDSFPVSHGSGKRTEVLEHRVYISRKLKQKQSNWISSQALRYEIQVSQKGQLNYCATHMPHLRFSKSKF